MLESHEPSGPRPIGAFVAAAIVAGFVLGTTLVVQLMVHVLAIREPLALAAATVRTHPIFAGIAQTLATVGVVLAVRARYLPEGPLRSALGIHPVSGRSLVLATIVGLTLQLPLAEIGNVVEELIPVAFAEKEALAAILAPTTFLDGLGLTIAVTLIAPVAEELVFRGILLPGIARGSGMLVGVVISSVGFAIAHGRPGAVVVALVGGLVLAFVTIRANSILPSIVLHASTNAVPVLLPARVLPIVGFNVVAPEPLHVALPLVATSALASVLALVLFVREAHPR